MTFVGWTGLKIWMLKFHRFARFWYMFYTFCSFSWKLPYRLSLQICLMNFWHQELSKSLPASQNLSFSFFLRIIFYFDKFDPKIIFIVREPKVLVVIFWFHGYHIFNIWTDFFAIRTNLQNFFLEPFCLYGLSTITDLDPWTRTIAYLVNLTNTDR